ncbi:hypothetical protein KPH14_006624 [Odynerus spinipes]|uniref:MoaB/Mog domain-containing protein n=1 Tax=Odynerus spinipes TaxID=1348599 RepID=A0AAD9RR45_9HYME|nr:hypothetical protein KPH14_006624 [Odynerus spinipes]
MLHIHKRILHDRRRFYQSLLHSQICHSTKDASAGIIIIGNEILKARVKDTNSHYACSLLYNCGVKVEKISVISDNMEEIQQEIRTFSEKYTHVITAGGIGPTHDDITFEGLAKAFNDSLHFHPKLVDIIKNQFGIQNSTSPNFKMAYVPTKASLIFGKEHTLMYPCVTLKNVYVFPGSPHFFEKAFGKLCKELFSTNRCFARDEIYINAREDAFADVLTVLTKEFPNVSFGSYPVIDNSYYKAFITIESDNAEETKKAKQKLCDLIGPDILVEYDNSPHIDSLTKYRNFLKKCERPFIYEGTLEKLTNIYHQPEKVAIYLDGSIETFIIVHLAHLARTLLRLNNKLWIIRLKSSELFRDMEGLPPDSIERYNINVSTLEGDLLRALNKLKLTEPQLETLLVGTEKTKFNEASSGRSSSNDITKQLHIIYPLDKWTKEDIRIFGRFLCLPLK